MSFSVERLKSPGIECLSAAAATAKSSASPFFFEARQTVDEPGGEGVARADAVDDRADLVGRAGEELLRGPHHGRPAVPVGALALAQGDGHAGGVREGGQDRRRQRFVGLDVELPGRDVGRGADAERLLAVLLVPDDEVRLGRELPHDFGRGTAVFPELGPVVEVERHGHSLRPGRLDGLEREGRGRGAEGRGDAGHVETVHPVQGARPIDVPGLGFGDARALAVVEDLGGPLVGPGLGEVEAQPAPAPHDGADVDAVAAELAQGRLAHRVGRHDRDPARPVPEDGQGHGHVGLAPAEHRLEARRLKEQLFSRRRQPQHDLAERRDIGHPALSSGPYHIKKMGTLLFLKFIHECQK